MALSVKFKNEGVIKDAHIPFQKEMVKKILRIGEGGQVEYIQADGDELNFILQRFVNLPHSHGICQWRGEMANFIAANFPYP